MAADFSRAFETVFRLIQRRKNRIRRVQCSIHVNRRSLGEYLREKRPKRRFTQTLVNGNGSEKTPRKIKRLHARCY